MRQNLLRFVFVGACCGALVTSAACTSEDDEVDGDTTARGVATYEDARTDSSGQPQQPATPEPQPANDPMRVEIRVEGMGTLDGLDPQCSLDGLSGAFDGLYTGQGSVDDDGVYVAGFASSTATFETPTGCEIPTLEIGTVTNVVVRGELSATTTNCQSYCSAKARSSAETECSGNNNEASCRATAESEYAASCQTQCTTTNHRIVAETQLSATAAAELSARNLSGAALGELFVDLTYDRIEDGSGNIVNESP